RGSRGQPRGATLPPAVHRRAGTARIEAASNYELPRHVAPAHVAAEPPGCRRRTRQVTARETACSTCELATRCRQLTQPVDGVVTAPRTPRRIRTRCYSNWRS